MLTCMAAQGRGLQAEVRRCEDRGWDDLASGYSLDCIRGEGSEECVLRKESLMGEAYRGTSLIRKRRPP